MAVIYVWPVALNARSARLPGFAAIMNGHNTEAALLKAEAQKIEESKDAKKKKVLIL
jgi:hypothetical protein